MLTSRRNRMPSSVPLNSSLALVRRVPPACPDLTPKSLHSVPPPAGTGRCEPGTGNRVPVRMSGRHSLGRLRHDTHRASRSVAAVVRPAARAVAFGPALAVLAGVGRIAGMVCTVLEWPFRARPCAPDRQSRSSSSLLTSCEPAPRRPLPPSPAGAEGRACRRAAPRLGGGELPHRRAEASGGGTGRHLRRAGARAAPYSGEQWPSACSPGLVLSGRCS
ncbi:morphogenic membrane protein MmpA [Streptomyces chlorus]|uniref:Morphogenic membrane protein MmpA n=1 Tax=Streptomyces chlorus TaxID=887452 RepID=A0ABW1E1S7_9ACTN